YRIQCIDTPFAQSLEFGMADRAILLTYRDYCELPDDGRRYEIHDGELSVTPAPNPRHQRLVGALYRALFSHIRSRGLGAVLPLADRRDPDRHRHRPARRRLPRARAGGRHVEPRDRG